MDGNRRHGKEAELRLILLGKSGGGKSATGNSILRREAFQSMLGARTTTLQCQLEETIWNGQKICVIDTPDIVDSPACSEIAQRDILVCIKLSRPGPHALVFVTQVGRFTAEDEAAVKQVEDVFGMEATKHMVVLFTRREDLDGESLRDYVRGSGNQAVLELMEKCGDRYCAFNNRAKDQELEEQVSELMAIIQNMVRERGGRHYTNDLYSEPHLTDAKLRVYMTKNRRCRQAAERVSTFRDKKWLLIGLVVSLLIVFLIILLILFS